MRSYETNNSTVAGTPVIVLTGFLGSGKTSLLNKVLKSKELENTLVLVNEFGDVGVDHDLVAESSEDVILLNSGCICCNIRGDLRDTLESLEHRVTAGEIRSFDRILIETSGLTDPVPLLHTFALPEIAELGFHVTLVVTTFDTVLGLSTLTSHEESRRHLAVADIVVTTKEDLAEPESSAQTKLAIKQLCPQTEVMNADTFVEELAYVLEKNANAVMASSNRAAEYAANFSCGDCGTNCAHGVFASWRNAHVSDYETLSVRVSKPLTEEIAKNWLNLISKFRGGDLLRVKGLLSIGGAPYAVHVVQHIVFPLQRLKAWPTRDYDSRLVFIAKDLDCETIQRSLDVVAQDAGELAAQH